MRSGLEAYAAEKLTAFRESLKSRDRAVVLGAILSVTPIFPACFIGVIISLVNLMLIHKHMTSPREGRLVKISLAVGCINSLIWLYLLIAISETLGIFLGNILDITLTPLNFLNNNPSEQSAQPDVTI